MKLPAPVRPLYVWGGYLGSAVLLSVITGGAEWVKSFMGLYMLWAIVETIRFYRHKKKAPAGEALARQWVDASEREAQVEQVSSDDVETEIDKYRGWTEDDEVRESQRDFDVLWNGKKSISFIYRNKGHGSPLEITATVTKVISPEFGEDAQTYFQGVPDGGVQRYFCLGYVKGRKVTETSTGEVGTLRQILGVKRRVAR